MCNMVVVTFDNCEEAIEIHHVLRQLGENSAFPFDATAVTKDDFGNLRHYPTNAGALHLALQASLDAASNQDCIQELLDALPCGHSTPLLLMEDDDSNTALLTLLLLFTPSTLPEVVAGVSSQCKNAEAHLQSDLAIYQDAVASLEGLDVDSTEEDVEIIFRAVDTAYNQLVGFITAGQPALVA